MSRATVVHDPQQDLRFLDSRQVGATAWEIPVTRSLITLTGGLYGGAGLAAVVAAMEAATGRPTRWVTCQFAASAKEGQTLRVDVGEDARGHRVSQAHAVATVDGRVALRASAALGDDRDGAPSHHWLEMPDVPGPEDCEEPLFPGSDDDSAITLSERRLAFSPDEFEAGHPRGPGFRIGLWTRIIGHDTGTAAMLGWIADMVPMGVGVGLGERMGGSSLDNTLRIVASVSADWVLVDLRPTSASGGYGHGDVHLWTPEGQLLATGSQTAAMRPRSW